MGSLIGSGIITFVLTACSAVVFFLMMMLGLNGFMGQQRAVNAAIGTYLVPGGLIVLAATLLSILATRLLQRRFSWHALPAVMLPVLSFSMIAGLLHFGCVVIAGIVAEQMRTGR